jgi:hypothetical protein
MEPLDLGLSASKTELNKPLFFLSIQLQVFCYSNRWTYTSSLQRINPENANRRAKADG